MMVYVKALLAGCLGAVTGAVLWILLAFVLPFFGPMLYWRVFGRFTNRGIGAASASISSGSILLAALVGFLVGAFWAVRRYRVDL
jgi:hypothetical protein